VFGGNFSVGKVGSIAIFIFTLTIVVYQFYFYAPAHSSIYFPCGLCRRQSACAARPTRINSRRPTTQKDLFCIPAIVLRPLLSKPQLPSQNVNPKIYARSTHRRSPPSPSIFCVHSNNQVNKPYSLDTIPVPEPEGKDILVKVGAASFCHTDALALDGSWPVEKPCTGSHEGAGTIVKLGPDVPQEMGFKVGDRVGLHCFYHLCGRSSTPSSKKVCTRVGTNAKGNVWIVKREGWISCFARIKSEH